jgi:hypothetical protein
MSRTTTASHRRPSDRPGLAVWAHDVSLETRIGIGVAALAVAGMAVDHLLDEDGGMAADPGGFALTVVVSLALAAFVFGRVVPQAKASPERVKRATKAGLVCGLLAVPAVVTSLWLGLPFALAGGAIALGLIGRKGRGGRRATAAVVIGAIVLVLGAGTYVEQAVSKLS